jgi:hypothetical protein
VRGETLIVTPHRQILAHSKPGDVSTVKFTVWNLTRTPLRIVGASSSCTCTATPGLPISIPAIDRRPVAVEFQTTSATLGREQHVLYYTDSLQRPRISVSLLATSSP